MKEETKDKIKDVAADAATDATEWLKEEAKRSTGLMRWVYGILALLGMGVCVWLSSCNGVPSVELTPEQVQAAETIYTALGGEVRYRVIPVESVKAD